MGAWGIVKPVNYSNFYCTSVTCFFDEYNWDCLPYKDGSVGGYLPGSAPAELAAKYGISGDGLVADAPRHSRLYHATYGPEMVDIITNPSTKMNHNGIEFYNSVEYRSNGNPVCSLTDLPDDATSPLLDPFATLVYTNGVNTDSHTGWTDNHVERVYQLGQTEQVYKKMTAVLNEYFSDWKTNRDRTLDIVCHSQGCLATRSAISTFRSSNIDNPINHINSIVSVNSPAIGSALALDGSGVHSVQRLRDIGIGIYKNGGLDPLIGGAFDPFKDIRTLMQDFLLRQIELSYANSFANGSWSPSASSVASAGVTNGSQFITNLLSGAAPVTRPSDGSKIPLTALYGTVPGLGTKLMNYAVGQGRSACNTGAGMVNLFSTVASNLGLTDRTCMGWVNYIDSYLTPIFTEMDVQWTPNSDMVVDKSSQQYIGKLNPFNHPFISSQLQPFPGDLGVPHSTIGGVGAGGGDLKGACLHGKEIVKALANPPKQKVNLGPILSLLQ
jgi:hypothetical protein